MEKYYAPQRSCGKVLRTAATIYVHMFGVEISERLSTVHDLTLGRIHRADVIVFVRTVIPSELHALFPRTAINLLAATYDHRIRARKSASCALFGCRLQ